MGKDETCKRLCVSEPIPKDDAQYINQCINDGYALNFVVDGLPAAHISTDERTDEEYYSIGFRLGESDAKGPVLNNHYDIYIDYHERPDGKKRVVGVVVTASSFDRDPKAEKVACDGGAPLHLKDDDGSQQVVYTYSVTWRVSACVDRMRMMCIGLIFFLWQASKLTWATRWDNYLHVLDPSIHWFSLVNSVVIVLFLTGMVAMILLRALHKDISRYNAVEAQVLGSFIDIFGSDLY